MMRTKEEHIVRRMLDVEKKQRAANTRLERCVSEIYHVRVG